MALQGQGAGMPDQGQGLPGPSQVRGVPAPAQGPFQEAQSGLAAITVSSRVASFWRDMPRLWFSQLEAILAPQKIGQEARFDLVISKLGKEELNVVSDLLESTDKRNYDILKNRLIATFQESADVQFNRLVKELDLGDQKPSQLFRKMAEAARNAGVADGTLKKLWLQRLPAAVRAILAVSEEAKAENLVAMADKILESMRQGVVAAVETPEPTTMVTGGDFMNEFRNMVLEIRELRGEVNALRAYNTERQQPEGRRSRSRSRNRRTPGSPGWLCAYHFKFRERARSCVQPCAWDQRQQVSTAQAGSAWQQPHQQGN